MPQVPVYHALDPGAPAAAFNAACPRFWHPLALVQVPHLQFLGPFNTPRPILPKARASDFITPPPVFQHHLAQFLGRHVQSFGPDFSTLSPIFQAPLAQSLVTHVQVFDTLLPPRQVEAFRHGIVEAFVDQLKEVADDHLAHSDETTECLYER